MKYGATEKSDVSLRVVADHARTAMMLIGDGVLPGNEGRGYVLRRMMRRTIRNMRILGAPDHNTTELITAAIGAMGPQYPELIADQQRILAVANAEEDSFLQTLKSGTTIFDVAVTETISKVLSGDTVFKLHDTYGFPFDLTLEMATEQGLSVDENGFRSLMKEQKERAKADAKSKKTGHTDLSEYRSIIDRVGSTKFLGYTEVSSEAALKAILVNGKEVAEATVGTDVEIVLDRTPFYSEAGGQLADGGTITLSNGATIEIDDVQSPVPGLFVHRGRITDGAAVRDIDVLASINSERRMAISRAHTATHMVHKAFREALGETATQAGSENAPGRFRFDFPASGSVPASVLADVEARVNSVLVENLAVTAASMSQSEAKAIGAMALFGEKYGETVRVVSIGDWARELCGGTHVSSSAQLGLIKLTSESSIGAGVRRVEALVGFDAFDFLAREHLLLNSLTEIVKGAKVEELPERISSMIERMKSVERELSEFKLAKAMASVEKLLGNFEDISGAQTLIATLESGIAVDDLRSIAIAMRERRENSIVILASESDGRVNIVAAVSLGARERGVKAGALIKSASTILGGGGGGKDDFAQGCGSNVAELVGAFTALRSEITSAISASK